MLLRTKLSIFNYMITFLSTLCMSHSLFAAGASTSIRIKAPNTVLHKFYCPYAVGAVIQQTIATNTTHTPVPSQFHPPAAGGTLCPGKYDAYASCAGLNTNAESNPCSGNSCGWSIDMYSGSTRLASRLGHSHAWADYGNFWENQTNVSLWTSTVTLDTNVNTQGITSVVVWVEGNNWEPLPGTDKARGGFCTVHLTATELY